MDMLMDDRSDSALDEIQERLCVIYNKIRQAREDIASAKSIIVMSESEITRLERKANEYVALLAPEGNPA